LPVGFSQSRPLWDGFASSARQWDFSMPGDPGKGRPSFNANIVLERELITLLGHGAGTAQSLLWMGIL
jgi:hypothetical protein